MHKPRRRNGPFFVHFDGLHASLRSENMPRNNRRSMLVSHGFVELLRLIKDDNSFDKDLFNALSEDERDFMKFLFKRCKIDSREFDNAYNKTVSHLVDRLHMLQSAIKIGDDNATLALETRSILDKLYQKNVFSHQFYNQLKRSLNA
jgi:hypothetical protein